MLILHSGPRVLSLPCSMSETRNLESLFVDNLELIERIASAISRRHGLRRDDSNDWISWVKLSLIENDYEILHKYRGESMLSTYLTVVVAMLYRDYRVQRWGRWRPSAAARRRGPVAVRLESLVYRQGYRFAEAAETLRVAGHTSLGDRELAALLSELPRRRPLRPVEVPAENASEEASRDAEARPDAGIDDNELRSLDELVMRGVDLLSAEDRVILRMRFWEGASVADIARTLHLPQKPLYRRLERALATLRLYLESVGVSRAEAQELLQERAS